MLRSPGSDAVDLLRAPLGALPCLYASVDDAWIVASDVDYLIRLGGYRPMVDWEAILRFALAPDARVPETCLKRLRELQGGDRLALRGASTENLWSPWQFADHRRRLDDPIEAQQRLRDTILSSMGSALEATKRSIILLSGGLDSSIVSATVAKLGLDAECVTISTSARSGDERDFARRTANHLGLRLTEAWFELEAVELTRSGAAHLPRPVARAFEWEARRQSQRLAKARGCDATLSGGGGDNIFCALQSVAPAVDALVETDGRREFWRVARDLSALTSASLPAIAWRAMRRSWQPTRP